MELNILIIGSGGREHALAWKVAQSPLVSTIYVAPGNGGTEQEPKTQNVDISATDIPALLTFAKTQSIDLTIVGPEAPLVAGIVDAFQQESLAIFGPNQKAAQLEGSKAFCKDFMKKYQIPTADYQTFQAIEPAIQYIEHAELPLVIKASGLAAGKGVVIAKTKEVAQQTVQQMLSEHQFGEAGKTIVIESFLTGEELSYIVMVDGRNLISFASSQDHKARDDNDKGPNTGGMGAYSPAPILTPELEETILQSIIWPTIQGLNHEGITYTGFLYAGLMIDKEGKAKVLEYNCRLGDPETQPLLMRLESDLIVLILSALNQELSTLTPIWSSQSALGVVMAETGYPGAYQKGHIIQNLPLDTQKNKTFHAGTLLKNGQLLTHGGRVLCVTALGQTLQTAHINAYQAVKHIECPSLFYRHDIGYKALKRKTLLSETCLTD